MSSLPHPDPHYCAFFFFHFIFIQGTKACYSKCSLGQEPWRHLEHLHRNLRFQQIPEVGCIHICGGFIMVSVGIKRPQIRVDQKRNVQEINKAEVTQRASDPPQGPPSCGSPCKHAAGSQLLPALSPTFPSSFLHCQSC